MIIQRYLTREILFTFIGVSLLLLVIFLSGTFIRILAEAAEGALPVRILFELFGLKVIANLVLILPLALFLSVLLALGRLYADSEMVAMTACGVTPGTGLKAVVGVAVVLALLVALLTLLIAPWAEERSQQLLDEASAQTDIEGVTTGRFNALGSDGLLLYVGRQEDEGGRLSEIFSHQRSEEGVVELLTAASVREQRDGEGGERHLILEDGHRYEGTPGEGAFRVIRFAEHGIRVEEPEVNPSQRRRNALPSARLFESENPTEVAELQWRLSMPITLILLAMLAVPLSRTAPRQGRYGKFFLGIFAYLIYNNLLTASRSSVARGDLPPEIGLWWVHLLAIGVVFWLLRSQYRIRAPKGRATG